MVNRRPDLFQIRNIPYAPHFTIAIASLITQFSYFNTFFIICPYDMLPWGLLVFLHLFEEFPNVWLVHLVVKNRISKPYMMRYRWNYNFIFQKLCFENILYVMLPQQLFFFFIKPMILNKVINFRLNSLFSFEVFFNILIEVSDISEMIIAWFAIGIFNAEVVTYKPLLRSNDNYRYIKC